MRGLYVIEVFTSEKGYRSFSLFCILNIGESIWSIKTILHDTRNLKAKEPIEPPQL